MKINDFLYVSLILEILYLPSTKSSCLMTLCKNWLERVKINFMRGGGGGNGGGMGDGWRKCPPLSRAR